jgi:hypothetical protein
MHHDAGGTTNWLEFLPSLAHGHAMRGAGEEPPDIFPELQDNDDNGEPNAVADGLIDDLREYRFAKPLFAFFWRAAREWFRLRAEAHGKSSLRGGFSLWACDFPLRVLKCPSGHADGARTGCDDKKVTAWCVAFCS